MSETVKNTSGAVVDLADGTPLGPGEVAEDVAVTNRHNKFLIEAGLITVVGSNEDDAKAEPEPDTVEEKTSKRHKPEEA